MTRPRILAFDDDPDWTTVIKESLEPEIEVQVTNNPENWSLQIRSTRWDAIIVDVEILGSDLDGVELAEKAIREFGVTAPIIIITGIADLEGIEKDYKKIFFRYISKNNFNEPLIEATHEALSPTGKYNHMWNMITGIARKHKILNKICGDYPKSEYPEVSKYMENPNGKTIQQVIENAKDNSGDTANIQVGRSVLSVIYYEIEN